MRLSTAALAGFAATLSLAAAVAQGDGFGYLPYPGDANAAPPGTPGTTGLYVALRGSMAFRGKDGATAIPTTPAPTALRGSRDTGWGGSVVVGTRLPYGFNAELEASYRRSPFTSKTMGGVTTAASGFRDTAAVMANLVYEAPLHEYGLPITPYIGGGAGLAYGRSRLSDNPASTNLYLDSSSNGRFAWQGLAGVKFDLAPGARFSLGYRYMQVDKVRSRCGTGGAATLTCTRDTVDQGVDAGFELDL